MNIQIARSELVRQLPDGASLSHLNYDEFRWTAIRALQHRGDRYAMGFANSLASNDPNYQVEILDDINLRH